MQRKFIPSLESRHLLSSDDCSHASRLRVVAIFETSRFFCKEEERRRGGWGETREENFRSEGEWKVRWFEGSDIGEGRDLSILGRGGFLFGIVVEGGWVGLVQRVACSGFKGFYEISESLLSYKMKELPRGEQSLSVDFQQTPRPPVPTILNRLAQIPDSAPLTH